MVHWHRGYSPRVRRPTAKFLRDPGPEGPVMEEKHLRSLWGSVATVVATLLGRCVCVRAVGMGVGFCEMLGYVKQVTWHRQLLSILFIVLHKTDRSSHLYKYSCEIQPEPRNGRKKREKEGWKGKTGIGKRGQQKEKKERKKKRKEKKKGKKKEKKKKGLRRGRRGPCPESPPSRP